MFLHATGSVLHYGTNTWRDSHALQGTVFMQPQFIIDVVKYIIRESNAADINDEVRAQDTRIRKNDDDAEVLDRFLGTEIDRRLGCADKTAPQASVEASESAAPHPAAGADEGLQVAASNGRYRNVSCACHAPETAAAR